MADDKDPLAAEIPALRRRLGELEKHELVELCVQLTATYVLEGLGTLGQAEDAAQPARAYDNVGDETFAGMIRRLKAQRPGDPVLDKFILNGEHIQVRTPMGNVDVTEYRRPTAPAAAPAVKVAPAQPSVPTSRDSIYNRELYAQANQPAAARPGTPAPAPAAPTTAATPPAPGAPAARPAPAQPAAAKDKDDQKKSGERFRMIELD